jgi:hypothetical protein
MAFGPIHVETVNGKNPVSKNRLQNKRIENSIQVQDDIEPPQNICRYYCSNRAALLADRVYLEIRRHKKRLLSSGK